LFPLQPVKLQLLDIPIMQECCAGVVMELIDCAFPLLSGVTHSGAPEEAFKDCDCAILVGAMPRREGMERRDLLEKNGNIFKVQGTALNKVAKKSVKVLVVGNPANTNALICSRFAPSIPKSQFTSLTQLDQNRAQAQIAQKLGVRPPQVKNVIIWGNHSATQYPDVSHAQVVGPDGTTTPVMTAIPDHAYLRGLFMSSVQNRGRDVIKARKLSSAMSAAKAIGDHMRQWWYGTAEGEFTSMGVISEGRPYGVDPGIVYSLPVTIKEGVITPFLGLAIDDFSREMLEKTMSELLEERDQALRLVGL
jgi:malate dehydrogenase